MLTDLVALFPELATHGYSRTSKPTRNYNCIAWAAGEDHQWWEPDPLNLAYWPPTVPRQYTMKAYILAYASLGYERCKDGTPEAGYEKVALYSIHGQPKHAARQFGDKWTSKLGPLDDITHTLEGLIGTEYGAPGVFMRRAL